MREFAQKIRQNIKTYLTFELSNKELITVGIIEYLKILIVSFLFYDSIFVSLAFLSFLPHMMHIREKEILTKRKNKIVLWFKDGMRALASCLEAGYSIENCFSQAAAELINLHGELCLVAKEFVQINNKLNRNENVEDAVAVMAKQLELEDAMYFAQVFRFAKNGGGNLIEIMKKTTDTISEKMKVKEDINVLISGKKMEQKIMNLMPFGIIAYLRIACYEFISPVYGNLTGISIMTACLGLYLVAKKVSDRIVEITV